MVCNKEDSRLEETENIKKISKIIKKLFALNNTTFFELSNITKKPINTGNSNWPKLAKEMKKKGFNKSEKQCQERLF